MSRLGGVKFSLAPAEPPPVLIESQFEDPSTLASVMVWRPRLCRRHTCQWMSCRYWKRDVAKPWRLLAAAKDSLDEVWIEAATQDVLRLLEAFPVLHPELRLTAPSPRHSAFVKVDHFASRIAMKVAESLGLEFVRVFDDVAADRRGHHPRREKDPPKFLPGAVIPRRLLMIDDLVTSGQTFESHMDLLRSVTSGVMGVAWIQGSMD